MSKNNQNPTRQDEEPGAKGRSSSDPLDRDRVQNIGGQKEDLLHDPANGPMLTPLVQEDEGPEALGRGTQIEQERPLDEGSNRSISSNESSQDSYSGMRLSARDAHRQEIQEAVQRETAGLRKQVVILTQGQVALQASLIESNDRVKQLVNLIERQAMPPPALHLETKSDEPDEETEPVEVTSLSEASEALSTQKQESASPEIQQVSNPEPSPKDQLGSRPYIL